MKKPMPKPKPQPKPKLQTYAESRGEEPFDWFKELSKPVISDDRWEVLDAMASKWTMCACGNQCSIIPRDEDGEPKDQILHDLGGIDGFYGCIIDKDAEGAIEYLHKFSLARVQRG